MRRTVHSHSLALTRTHAEYSSLARLAYNRLEERDDGASLVEARDVERRLAVEDHRGRVGAELE